MEIQRSFLILTALALLISCGGKQSVASKSAAALQEAQKKGLPISGESHGGHMATVAEEGDQAGAVDHSTMPGMDHSQMAGMDHSQMKGVDHSQMAGMDHGRTKAMDHSQMPSAQHGNMAGMQHDMSNMQHGSAMIPPGGLWGPVPGSQQVAAPRAAPVLPLAASPRESTAISQLKPSSTLRADAQDAPAAVSVTEAQKSAGDTSTAQPPSNPHHGHRPDGGGAEK